jgi:hypothetical protein
MQVTSSNPLQDFSSHQSDFRRGLRPSREVK